MSTEPRKGKLPGPWLQCTSCGEDLFEPDAEGMFISDTTKVCLRCGTICWIDVTEEYDDDGDLAVGHAYVSSHDDCVDAGQPVCDGSQTDCWSATLGKPCILWYCPKTEGCLPLVEVEVCAVSSDAFYALADLFEYGYTPGEIPPELHEWGLIEAGLDVDGDDGWVPTAAGLDVLGRREKRQ